MSKCIKIIGIAGGSCCGKSYLCKNIKERFPKKICEIIPLDCYYRDLSHLVKNERDKQNFDVPEALEHELVTEHLNSLISGNSVNIPVYDFGSHTRSSKTIWIPKGVSVVLVEGLFALYWEQIRRLFSLKIFLNLNSEKCLQRRINRDIRNRSRNRDSVERQFRETVMPMYKANVAKTRKHADIELCGDTAIEVLVDRVLDNLKKFELNQTAY